MLKLIKYLKPFRWLVVAIFVLLFAQAMADLSLPTYMSDIVNIGIQQNGIENAVPKAVRAGEFAKLTLFMTDTEKATVTAEYKLIDRQTLSASDYADYVEEYPVLANEPLYVLTSIDKSTAAELNAIFTRYMSVVSVIETGGASVFQGTPLQIPSGVDPFSVLLQLTPDQLQAVGSVVQNQLQSVPESLLTQYSLTYVSAEYKAIGMDTSSMQTAYMIRIGMYMLLLTLASAAASIIVGFLSARTSAGLGRNLRQKLFIRVEDFSGTEFDKFSTASLITRSTNDITQVQLVMMMIFRFMFYAPILGIGGIIKVLGANSSMLWIIGAAIGVMLTMMVTVFTISMPKFNAIQKLTDRLNLVVREMLSGLMVIRAFNTQHYEENKFDATNIGLTQTNLFVNRVMVFMMPAIMLVMNGVMLLIVWIGSHQVDAGSMQVGSMMAFMQYAMQIIFSFIMVSIMFITVPRANVSANRIVEVLKTDSSIKDPEDPKGFKPAAKGVIEFQDVSFRYPEAVEDVLKNITFVARPGQTTALIGSTGSGKSSLVNLIPRFYDATGGRVIIDGTDVRDVTQHDLRERIGYVPQQAVLFSGTIESNIRYANENVSDGEIKRFATVAQANDFILTSDNGFESQVAQGGTNLSGGQKQRLSIARALARQPEIYIFDDSLSALDFKTEAALRKALKKETGDATVLIVTQRVSTIMGADQIIVLENGKVAGIGTHGELMKSSDVYREIAMSQLSQEELTS